MIFPIFQFVASVSCDISQCYWKGFGSFFFLHPWFFYMLPGFPKSFSFLGWLVTALTASPHMSDFQRPQTSSWLLPELTPVCPYLGSPEMNTELQIGITVLSRGKGSPPSSCWQHSVSFSPEGCRPPLLWGSVAGLYSVWCSWGLPGPSLQSCCPAVSPHLAMVLGVISQQKLIFSFLEHHEILLGPILQPVRSLWMLT